MEITHERKKMSAAPLLVAVGVIAICGIIYELIIGAISSYLLGNSVMQYSITIGLFMSAMGVGSYMSKYLKKDLFDTFILIELSIGLSGGLSALALFSAYALTSIYHIVMYGFIIMIGMLVGLEIPILTRIIESNESNLRVNIANVLSFDYIGALLGSIAFPLLLLPHLGEIRTAFFVGALNIAVALIMLFYYRSHIRWFRLLKVAAFLMLLVVVLGIGFGDQWGIALEDRLYRDQIIYSHQSEYQKIVVTQHKDDIRMFLNGSVQFSSLDEHRYHEALIHPVMSLASEREQVLILGGGDGLAAREVLKYEEVQGITLVDLDPAVVEFSRNNPLLSKLNEGALDHEKLTVIHQDAYQFIEQAEDTYDVVIIDLPDPSNESLNKLYSNIFYRMVYAHLNEGGMMVIQSSSPYHAGKAFWCIQETVASEDFITKGYHINIPAFGDWGYTIASNQAFSENDITIDVDTDFLNQQTAKAMFSFSKDELKYKDEVSINRLTNAVLVRYYEEAWNDM